MRTPLIAGLIWLAMAVPVRGQTVSMILEPGSASIAQTLCARLAAYGVADTAVFVIPGLRVRVEHNAAPNPDLQPAALNALLTRRGVFGIHRAAFAPAAGLVRADRVDADAGPVFIEPDPLLTAADLDRAEATFQFEQPALTVAFDRAGTRVLAEATEKHLGRPLAIMLDGRVVSAPVVREAIRGGSAVVSGIDTTGDWAPVTEIALTAAMLTGGALPQALTFLEAQPGGEPGATARCRSD